ncbi:MAG: 8-amino-7-oxononanoate synthase [Muribaculaceae bacterium]|nr:8-amino-7-oxononanoate synthase [Muribaculaceae bacterium]
MEIKNYLEELRAQGNYREIPTVSPLVITDYSANDYMGLAAQPDLQARFFADPISATVPMASSAARLLAPRQIEYTDLEVFLGLLYRKVRGADTSALIFNSGYHANTGLISAIAGKDTLILADRLVHASIIDGMVLSRAPFVRFRHNDFEHLEELLRTKGGNHRNVLVIVESVYSMDGDKADIERLIELKRSYPNVMLYVDEAHAFGVIGPRGLGAAAASSSPADIDVIVGTFGKAAASIGAFAVTGRDLHDYLVNTSRSFIFSTALPPMSVAWTRFTLGNLIMKDNRREHVARLGVQLKSVLEKYTDYPIEASHIQPLVVGDPHKAVELSRQLLSRYGIKALPIRKPTVPAGTERLRFSLSANMMPRDLEALDSALYDLM